MAAAGEAEELPARFPRAGSRNSSRRGGAAEAGATFIAIVCLQISPCQSPALSKASCLLLMTHEYNNAASPLRGVLSTYLNFLKSQTVAICFPPSPPALCTNVCGVPGLQNPSLSALTFVLWKQLLLESLSISLFLQEINTLHKVNGGFRQQAFTFLLSVVQRAVLWHR